MGLLLSRTVVDLYEKNWVINDGSRAKHSPNERGRNLKLSPQKVVCHADRLLLIMEDHQVLCEVA